MIPRIHRPAWRTALALAALAAVLAGCSGRAGRAASSRVDPHPKPADAMIPRMKEAGTYGGRFIIAQTSAPKTFNAIMANETSSSDLTNLMFITLADYDNSTQQDIPSLAKSWDISADGLTYTWYLRRGAAFSDGTPITSADVLFSFEVAYDDGLHPSIQDLLIIGGEKMQVSAPDSYTVVTRSVAPYALMVPAIGSLRIMPKHKLEAAFRAGNFASEYSVSVPPEEVVTSGPFRVKEFAPGEKVVLSGNPYWYGYDAKGQRLPYLDELVFLTVPDQNTAALKFQAGELDGLDNVKPEDYGAYEAGQERGNYTLYELGPSLTTNFFWFNLNKVREPRAGKKVGDPHVDPVKYAWFSQPDFRRAVSMAIDRDAIIRGPFYGDAVKNWSVLTESSKLWHTQGLGRWDLNVEAAKRLLEGLQMIDRDGDGVREDAKGRPIEFTIKTNGDNGIRVAMCNFAREDLAKVGIRLTLTPVDFNTLITNLRQDFQYEAIMLGLGSAVPSDPGMGQNVFRSTGLTHYWNIKQPRPETGAEAKIDELIDQNVATTDLEVRRRTWHEIDRTLEEQCFIIWMPTASIKIPASNRFGNLEPTIIPHRILWNVDRVYLKSAAQRVARGAGPERRARGA
jgi:peptide/nickel transport system substrate-binding protein